jgi:UDP-N-acetylglucosamine transferase subunit ALG13
MRLFVSVGTPTQPFDRMLRMVANAVGSDDAWSGTCQHGPSAVRIGALRHCDYLSRKEFESEVREADVVVLQAGVGAIASALDAGHRPIVVARLGQLGEHANDHQLQILTALAREGRIIPVATDREMRSALDGFRSGQVRRGTPDASQKSGIAHIERVLAGSLEGSGKGAGNWLLRLLAVPVGSVDRLRLK